TADATRIARLYAKPQLGLPPASTSLNGVTVALYDMDGHALDAQTPIIPPEIVRLSASGRRFWSGVYGRDTYRSILVPVQIGTLGSLPPVKRILVLSARTTYIVDATNAVAAAVAVVTGLLVALALAGGYWASSVGLRPLVRAAEQARRLDETNLRPLQYDGPRDELGLLIATLNHLVRRLKRAFDAQKVFLAETSHELRTPLTALEGYLHRAVREAPPENRPVLQDALRVSRSMTRLVSDLLQLSRGDVVQEWVPHVVDLGRIASSVTREFPGVTCDCPTSRAEVIGDPDRLTQLTRNLVANAVRATGRPDGVHVRVEASGTGRTLHVQDEGPGIPPDVLPHIFTKFYRGPKGGSGLGLAIAAQIARVHHTRIEVESAPGKGAHFWINFEAYEDEP
ncbi:MAG TPA: HAMP domain-containing sensor histidine kinase, partial [Deinococcales bacterium]|nr:HAMP domain-containing sensor histidine kinase [Deinococcales bacterium]